MSNAGTNINYLKDSARFPKETVTPVTAPQVQVSATEWNKVIEATSDIKDEVDNIPVSEDASGEMVVSDPDGNVAMRVDASGVNARVYNICDSNGNVVGTLNASVLSQLLAKQNALVSGQNLSTVNGNSLLTGSDIEIEPGHEEIDPSDDQSLNIHDEAGHIAMSVDSDGVKAKVYNVCDEEGNILFAIDAGFVDNISQAGVLLVGDSTSNDINWPFFINWCYLNEVKGIMQVYGGQQAPSLGMHIGATAIKLAESVTIPASAGSVVPLSVAPGLRSADGDTLPMNAFSGFDDNDTYGRKGMNPVTINGVEGTLTGPQDEFATMAWYTAAKAKVIAYDGTNAQYGNGVTWHPGLGVDDYRYVRIAINAISAAAVANNTAHLDIDGVSVDLSGVFTIANKALDNNGDVIDAPGFYLSDYIDISSYLTDLSSNYPPVYNDGIGTSQPYFVRSASGSAITVEKGSCIMSSLFQQLARKHSIIFYLNNVDHNVKGDTIEEKILTQIAPVLEYAKNGQFLYITSHFAFHDYTDSEIEAIDALMSEKFGNRYINMYRYLSTCGIADAIRFGVLTSSQVSGYDWKQVFLTGSDGAIGGSLNVHENWYGAYMIFRKIIEVGADLGYWEVGTIDWTSLYNNKSVYPGWTPWYNQ